MDWSRIKSILIWGLLITNILLGLMIFEEKMMYESERRDQLNNVMALITTKGIGVSQDALDFPERVDSVVVEYEQYGEDKVTHFLGNDYQYNEGKYFSQDSTLLMTDTAIEFIVDAYYTGDDLLAHKHFKVKNTKAIENYELMTYDAIEAWAFPRDYTIDTIEKVGDFVVVTARQTHENYVLEDSKMELVFYEDKVVNFKRTWLNIINAKNSGKYDIISIGSVLFSMLPSLESGDEIESIELIYKLNDSSLIVSNLVSGEALPYYKIKTSDEEDYYIQAITEE